MNRILAFSLVIFLTAISSASALDVPAACGPGSYLRKVDVSTVAQLKSALSQAIAGDYIAIAAGTYQDLFVVSGRVGTSTNRIFICGEDGVLFKAKTLNGGYGLSIKNSKFLRVSNIHIEEYLKGVMLDNSSGVILQNLFVKNIGNEGVHFRTNSKNNLLMRSEISHTGLVNDFYGEGVYVGSAESNWCTYTNCNPDQSDGNKIMNNYIHHTAAESIDIKEGTTGGLVQENTFEGQDMTGDYADSFVDVKGNNYIIDSNAGTTGLRADGSSYQQDGFQVHVAVENNGSGNSFTSNTVSGILPGYVVWAQNAATQTSVTCDNVDPDGSQGSFNYACQ